MSESPTLPVAEEASIDREIEQRVAKMVSGEENEGDRRAYNALLMRRAQLVFQMALSAPRPSIARKRAFG